MAAMEVPAYGVRPGDLLILSDEFGVTKVWVTRITADSTHIKFAGKGGEVIVPRDMKVTVK